MGVTEGKIRDTGEGSGSGTSGSSRTRRTTHGVARGMTSDNVTTTTMHSGHRLARLRLKPGSAPIHPIHHTSNTTEGEEDTTSRSSPIPVNNNVSSAVNSVPWQKNKKNKHCDTETHSARPALTSIVGGDSSSSSTRSQPMRLVSRSRGTVNARSTTHTSGPIVRVVSPSGSRTTPGITTTATTPAHRGRRSVPKHQVPELRQTVFTSLLAQSGFVDTTPSDLTALASPPIPIASTLLMSAGAGDSASNHSMSSVAESHHYMLSSTPSSQEPHTTHALPMLVGSTREGMTLGPNEQLPPPYLSSTYSGHMSHANSSTTSVQVPPTRTLAPTLITTNTTNTNTNTTSSTTTTPAPPQLPGGVLAATSPTALAQSPQECCTMSLLIPSNNLAGMSFSEVSLSNHGNSTGSAYVPLIQSSIAMGNGAGGGSLQQIASHAGGSLVRGPTLPSSVPNSTKPHLTQPHTRHPMHDTSGIATAASSWARLQTVPSSPVQPDRGVSGFASSHTAPASASLTLSNATTAVLGTGVGLTDVPYWGRHATQQQVPQQVQLPQQQQQQPRSTSMLGTFSQMSITDVELSASFTIYLKKTVEFARAMVREGLPFHFDHQRDVMQLYDLLGLDTDNDEEEEAERHKVEDDDEKDDVVDTAEKAVGTTYEPAMALHMASSVLLAEQDMTAYQRRLRRYRFPPPEMSQLREDTAEAAKQREVIAVHMLGRRELARRQREEQKRQRRNEQKEKSGRQQQQQQQKGVQRCESIASSTSGSRVSVRKVDTPASRGHTQPQSSLILSHGDGYQLTSNMGSTTTTTTGSSGSTSSAGTQCSALGPGGHRAQQEGEVQPSSSLRQKEETNEEAIAMTNATTVTTRKERGIGRIAPRHRAHVHHHIHDFLLPLRGNEAGYTCMDEVHAHRRVVLARAAFLDSDEDDKDEAENAEANAGEQAASAQGM